MNAFARALFMRQVVPWLAALLLAGGGIAAGYFWLDEQVQLRQQQLQQKKRHYRGLYDDVQFLMEQYSLQQEYGALFWKLRQQGLVSRVKRDRWVDSLLLFSEAYGFRNYAHVFRPAVPPGDQKLGTVKLDRNIFQVNPVVTQADMPLDVDFVRFYRYFKSAVTPYSLVNACRFVYVEDEKSRSAAPKARDLSKEDDLNKPPFDTPFKARCEWVVFTAEPRKRVRR